MYTSPTVVLTASIVGLGGSLAVTGFSSMLLALVGALLLVAGIVLVRLSMLHRRSSGA